MNECYQIEHDMNAIRDSTVVMVRMKKDIQGHLETGPATPNKCPHILSSVETFTEQKQIISEQKHLISK